MKIAGHKTTSDWLNLAKKLNPKDDDYWCEAFSFFSERIFSRYTAPIDAIIKTDKNNGEGFAIVNLQCSLIETIESFINGCICEYDSKKRKNIWKRTDQILFVNNRDIFISFFKNRFPFKTFYIDGADYYHSVRCALLHETQTKNNWKIKKGINQGYAFEMKDGTKNIYRNNFQRDLQILIDSYKNAIVNGDTFDNISSLDLRESFIHKFNYICQASKH